MGKMKLGYPTGQTDMNYTAIRIGDQIKNKNNQMVYLVNQYGSIACGSIVEKKWKGEDYIVVKPVSLPPEGFEPVEVLDQTEELAEESNIEIMHDLNMKYKALVDETNEKLVQARKEYQELREQGIMIVKDEELVAELRRRGFEVKATKTITIEL